ncbi:MAG: hypothetical protein OEZ01_10980 [Candidatus Heimdallarchaeota archaeon]|nr:hypothetical protein [Candidatus Heimdallarchaeota archaeon]MDH5646525.1 hypothetical protein [Candidatus Heimdallarchaeota archaeon]
MPKFKLDIADSDLIFIKELSEASGAKIEDLLLDLITLGSVNLKPELVIKQYKDGKLKAREAWKLSGLDYGEFQNRANT